jgi:hypothetical protein
MHFAQFPNLEEYLKNLEYLRSTDFSKKTYEEIHSEYFKNVISHHSMGQYFNEKNIPNLALYRVRPAKNISKDENLELLQTYSYPPAKYSENGRANIKGYPVFYCADDIIAAIKESRMSINEIGYVSIWKLRLRRKLSFSTYMPEILPIENTWSDSAKYYNSLFLFYLMSIPLEFREHKKAHQKLLVEKFISENKPYSLTSMICHTDLYKTGDVDFVVYPSVQTLQNYCNYAFHPNVASNNLVIDRVIRFKIMSFENGKPIVKFGEVGNRKNDRINWGHYENIELNEFE